MRLVVLGVLILALVPPDAGAAARVLIVRAETLTSGKLEPQVHFLTTHIVDTSVLAPLPHGLIVADDDLLLHDLDTGRTTRADDELALVEVTAPGLSTVTLGALLQEEGSIVFVRTPASGDLGQAEIFRLFSPANGNLLYYEAATPGTGPAPEPCGDVNLNGAVNSADVTLYRNHLADPVGTPFTQAAQDRCAVIAPPGACSIVDVVVMQRDLASLTPAIAQVCPAAP